MPLVFVHGVGNRLGPGYAAGSAMREALFRHFLLKPCSRTDGQQIAVLSPYWGELGSRMHWNGASLPLWQLEVPGSAESTLIDLYATTAPQAQPDKPLRAVLEVARFSLVQAVDVLWGAAALTAGNHDEAAGLATRVQAYAAVNEQPAWTYTVHNDTTFMARLRKEVDASFPATTTGLAITARRPSDEPPDFASGWQLLHDGLAKLQEAIVGYIGWQPSERLRAPAVRGVAEFLADGLVCLHEPATASAIEELVGAAIREAAATVTPADPLIVVAHSMGGNLVYDLLTSSLSDVAIDLFVTVGSQVGFFEELKLFRSSKPAIPGPGRGEQVVHPANVARWINMFDSSDLLGFSVGPVIAGVEDFHYATGALLKAHSHYFVQPTFHATLAARVYG